MYKLQMKMSGCMENEIWRGDPIRYIAHWKLNKNEKIDRVTDRKIDYVGAISNRPWKQNQLCGRDYSIELVVDLERSMTERVFLYSK